MASKAKAAAHTSITVRGLSPGVKQRLRERAAHHGHSLEAEVREILQCASVPRDESALDVLKRIQAQYGPLEGGEEFTLPSRRELWRGWKPPNFEK
jgi:plasmid stability protein